MELVLLLPSWQAFKNPLCNASLFVLAVWLWVERLPHTHGCGAALPWAKLDIGCMPSWVNAAVVDPSLTIGTSNVALDWAFSRPLHIELRLLASCGVFCSADLRSVHMHVCTFPTICPFRGVLALVPHNL